MSSGRLSAYYELPVEVFLGTACRTGLPACANATSTSFRKTACGGTALPSIQLLKSSIDTLSAIARCCRLPYASRASCITRVLAASFSASSMGSPRRLRGGRQGRENPDKTQSIPGGALMGHLEGTPAAAQRLPVRRRFSARSPTEYNVYYVK
jgi:hypothetical protein